MVRLAHAIAPSWTQAPPDATVSRVTHNDDRARLETWLVGRGEYELFPCDPALADTAAFCSAYGFGLEDAANTIVVVGKSDPPRYAACIVLGTHRLDANHAVRDRLGTRRVSFASAEQTQALTGQEIGGVTALACPTGFRPGLTPRLWSSLVSSWVAVTAAGK